MDKKSKLEEIKNKALADDKLPLRTKETNLVFGVGNPEAEILFIGEGPGYWENVKSEPFVSPAGRLLDKLLELINIKRQEVFITNVVMHRPPNNRDPLPQEIEAYRPYLDAIIETISPKIIVTLGRFSMAKFLPSAAISKVHGNPSLVKWGDDEITVVPMYHPAAALRSNEIMVKLREDFLKLPAILASLDKAKEKEEKEEEKQMALF
ncbi:MAG: Uracil-DNA glycosylase, family 4 [Candidatus Woesebacteria bacterium]|nr:MAG: Uracil-DNA glycosylase, family 4 [Candidatus Woesebacteria bacterium]